MSSDLKVWLQGAMERGEATMKLSRLGEDVDGVYLVMAAGESDVYVGGKRRDAMFYVDHDGVAKTAVMCGDGHVITRLGW